MPTNSFPDGMNATNISPAVTVATPRAQDRRSDANALSENLVSPETNELDFARLNVNLRRDSLVNRLGIDFARASENATASGVSGSTDARVEKILRGAALRFGAAALLSADTSRVATLHG